MDQGESRQFDCGVGLGNIHGKKSQQAGQQSQSTGKNCIVRQVDEIQEKLKELGLFSLEKTLRDLVNVYQYLMQYKVRPYSMVPSDSTRGNGDKMKHKKLHLNIRKQFSIMSMTKHQNTLPREVVACPSVDKVKA
ncbi:hypothetical protein llap_3638 [Limosa lapponica baueri]|uniref:Uncharacterized protein n=1 Tax=Limosa lapponica baueri TaxID=1758121 RepID=A0A2I0UJ43_LIMLA|nr:hypothetical protein llap_3638 [Limosa lapponica baueri]